MYGGTGKVLVHRNVFGARFAFVPPTGNNIVGHKSGFPEVGSDPRPEGHAVKDPDGLAELVG